MADTAPDDLDRFRDDVSKVPQTKDERYQFVFNEVRHALDQQTRAFSHNPMVVGNKNAKRPHFFYVKALRKVLSKS